MFASNILESLRFRHFEVFSFRFSYFFGRILLWGVFSSFTKSDPLERRARLSPETARGYNFETGNLGSRGVRHGSTGNTLIPEVLLLLLRLFDANWRGVAKILIPSSLPDSGMDSGAPSTSESLTRAYYLADRFSIPWIPTPLVGGILIDCSAEREPEGSVSRFFTDIFLQSFNGGGEQFCGFAECPIIYCV